MNSIILRLVLASAIGLNCWLLVYFQRGQGCAWLVAKLHVGATSVMFAHESLNIAWLTSLGSKRFPVTEGSRYTIPSVP
ncbi:hypothetical protein B0H63DRAFT_456915 [Podospora didyma]|uniref:Uncharacterized protein n=1 Tax=Podospora didyma TaxID=330526 RepID=A0AAE0U6M3_9PEZI|nr:hypothetical protein B0H63DRAFT_456915 [Podospora didyma]